MPVHGGHRRIGIIAGCGLALLLAGCAEEYHARRDTRTLNGGDAIAYNRALQTIDPWPAHAGNVDIPGDGQRMVIAVDRYKTNQSLSPQGLTEESKGDVNAGQPPSPAPAPE